MTEERRWSDQVGPRPWSNNQLRKLGKQIVQGKDSTETLTYSELVDWNSDLIFMALPRVRAASANELESVKIEVHVASRAKSLETVRDKLERDEHRPLGNIQDLAGIRVIADMSLDQQRAIARRIARDLRQPTTAVQSLLDGEHAGYRAIHVVCRFPELGNAYLEVQVRTVLQNSWANLYDALSDSYGRGIRYGGDPEDDVARARVQGVRGIVRFQVAQIEEVKTELSQVRREALTHQNLPVDLQIQLDKLEDEVETRAELLRRTMEDEEALVRLESNKEAGE